MSAEWAVIPALSQGRRTDLSALYLTTLKGPGVSAEQMASCGFKALRTSSLSHTTFPLL